MKLLDRFPIGPVLTMIVEQSVDRYQEVGKQLPRLGMAHGRLQDCLPHVVCEFRFARCSGSGLLPAGPDAGIVIRTGVSAKVQSLGSVDLVGGTLNDIRRIGLRSIRPIGGTAGNKRSDGECKADQAYAASKRSISGHGRGFLDRIFPVSRNIILYRKNHVVGSRIPLAG
jgi:hypothetical protein